MEPPASSPSASAAGGCEGKVPGDADAGSGRRKGISHSSSMTTCPSMTPSSGSRPKGVSHSDSMTSCPSTRSGPWTTDSPAGSWNLTSWARPGAAPAAAIVEGGENEEAPPGLKADEESEREAEEDSEREICDSTTLSSWSGRPTVPPEPPGLEVPPGGAPPGLEAVRSAPASAGAPSDEALLLSEADDFVQATFCDPAPREAAAEAEAADESARTPLRTPLRVTQKALAYSLPTLGHHFLHAGPTYAQDGEPPGLPNGLTSVVRAVFDQIPPNERGEASSLGSICHKTGSCYPCLFFFQSVCAKGVNCTYCHLQHHGQKKKRIRMSKKVREMQAQVAAVYCSQAQLCWDWSAQSEWA